jgi:hypothetical protein
MSSIWDVVIWSKYAGQLMPELEKFAYNYDRSAGFVRPPIDGGFMGGVDLITGQVNHLDPEEILQIVMDVHAAERFLYPATVLLSNEYDTGDPPRVLQLGDDGVWR